MKKMWTIKNAAVAVLGALFLGGICKLGIFFSVMLGISLFLLVPGIMSGLQKERESSERFLEVCIYLEQMEGAYRKNRRIYQSLLETEMLFRDGKMKEVLQKAVREYEKEDAGADVSKKALSIIEEAYGCEQMELMHDFFLRNEARGGNPEKAIGILDKRRNAWIEATEKCMSEKKNMLISVILSTVILFIVSEALMFFLPNEMNVMTKMPERLAVVIEISCLLCLIRRAIKKNAAEWLEKNSERPEKDIKREYLFIENYDAKRALFSSIKWACLPAGLMLLSYLLSKSFLSFAIGFPITILMLNQHKLDYALKKKRIKKEIERDYPKWLLGVILFMETESVQGAVFKSKDTAPNILKYPLEKMWETLQKFPTKPDAYFQFLEDYDVPRVHESMKLLYAISTGKGGNTKEQMLQIVEKNNTMTMQSERMKNDNKVAGMMGYLFYPVLPVGVKMMADMLLMMLTLYQNMGQVL